MAADNATYAIVKTGGKQYKVAVGDVVKIEKLDAEQGASVSLPVALVVEGAKVTT
ncbi:MAG: bL21 family ribosomal protein, partial [Actinobacteria bacterium]|nr:bL21 family ribosomal protein [Actinomycetota bacterium]